MGWNLAKDEIPSSITLGAVSAHKLFQVKVTHNTHLVDLKSIKSLIVEQYQDLGKALVKTAQLNKLNLLDLSNECSKGKKSG